MEIIQRQRHQFNLKKEKASPLPSSICLKKKLHRKKHSYNTNRKCINKCQNVKNLFSDNKRVHYIILTETRMISVSVNTWGISH